MGDVGSGDSECQVWIEGSSPSYSARSDHFNDSRPVAVTVFRDRRPTQRPGHQVRNSDANLTDKYTGVEPGIRPAASNRDIRTLPVFILQCR
jgi:hypothetical protein